MPLNVDFEKISALLQENSEVSIMPYYKNLSDAQVESKANNDDLVTIADEKSEQFLCMALTKMFPSCVVIGEEQVHQHPNAIDALKGDKPVWIIDPVDGTYNFRHAGRHFGVILSLIYNGVAVMGWHYFPLTEQLLVAEQGAGTWLDGEVCRMKSLDGVMGSTLQTFLHVANPPLFKKIVSVAEPLGINIVSGYRCSAYDYFALVTNERQCLVSTGCKVWDHAAGQLMVQEAGGVRVHFNGEPYTPFYAHVGQICAPSEDYLASLEPLFAYAPS